MSYNTVNREILVDALTEALASSSNSYSEFMDKGSKFNTHWASRKGDWAELGDFTLDELLETVNLFKDDPGFITHLEYFIRQFSV
jgi:hypothetical protein